MAKPVIGQPMPPAVCPQPAPPVYATLPDRETVNVQPLFDLVKRTCGEYPVGVEQPVRNQFSDMSDLLQQLNYFLNTSEEERNYLLGMRFNWLTSNLSVMFEQIMESMPDKV